MTDAADIRILVADDDTMVRSGLTGILGTDPSLRVAAEAGDGAEACDLARAHKPDVVLMDIRMPRLDGLAALASIHAELPEIPVVMLTTFSDEDYISRAVRNCAVGFLLKSGSPHELIDGVKAAANGGACFSPTVARWLIRHEAADNLARVQDAKQRVARLTERHREILAEVGRGRSNAEIAAKLYLSEGTVKGYLYRIFGELGIANRVSAAILAYEAGLVT